MNRPTFVFACTALCTLSMLALVNSSSHAATCKDSVQADSGTKTVSIAELYTSEGCDSCPPTDKWFSTLSLKKTGVVPLAFHVDYWDYIGWKDRFGKPGFADRQRTLVGLAGSRTVYTPQVLLNGKDSRNAANNAQFESSIRDLAAHQPQASIKLYAQSKASSIDVAVNVNLIDESLRKDSALYIALTENNLVSRVTAGENKGASLKHDHVVRELSGPLSFLPAISATSTPATTSGAPFGVKRSIDVPPDWKREDLNVVAFVQNTRSGQVLQAVSTPLCAP